MSLNYTKPVWVSKETVISKSYVETVDSTLDAICQHPVFSQIPFGTYVLSKSPTGKFGFADANSDVFTLDCNQFDLRSSPSEVSSLTAGQLRLNSQGPVVINTNGGFTIQAPDGSPSQGYVKITSQRHAVISDYFTVQSKSGGSSENGGTYRITQRNGEEGEVENEILLTSTITHIKYHENFVVTPTHTAGGIIKLETAAGGTTHIVSKKASGSNSGGSLFLAAGDVAGSGEAGDVFISGGYSDTQDRVTGNIYLSGQKLYLSGEVSGLTNMASAVYLNASGNVTLNSHASWHTITLQGNITIAFNFSSPSSVTIVDLELHVPAGKTVTWPANAKGQHLDVAEGVNFFRVISRRSEGLPEALYIQKQWHYRP